MSDALIVLGICLIFVLSAALPLIRGRGRTEAPPPPPKETLHDWRKAEREK